MERDEYERMAEVEASHWWYRATNEHLRTLLEPHLPSNGISLDVGCGTGAVGGFLRNHGTLVGLDFEHLAVQRDREAHPDVLLAAADAERLPVESDAFDVVLCVTVLCHAVDPRSAGGRQRAAPCPRSLAGSCASGSPE